jgi:dTMP kinase
MNSNIKPCLIVIGGTDGSGKETQLKHLLSNLDKALIKYKQISFPKYDSWSSLLVRLYLRKKIFGDPSKVNAKFASIFYALDRFIWSFKIRSWLRQGYIVVCDRYAESNQGHQGSKIEDLEKREALISWLEWLEYGVFKIPKPKLNIFLSVEPETVMVNMTSASKDLDGHENLSHIKKAFACYTWLANRKPYLWTIIDCMEHPTQMKSREDIAGLVIKEVLSKLSLTMLVED